MFSYLALSISCLSSLCFAAIWILQTRRSACLFSRLAINSGWLGSLGLPPLFHSLKACFFSERTQRISRLQTTSFGFLIRLTVGGPARVAAVLRILLNLTTPLSMQLGETDVMSKSLSVSTGYLYTPPDLPSSN